MKIAVVDLVSLDGGGYQITRSLFQYASSGKTCIHKWLFIVSKQSFESNQFAEVVKFPEASKGYWKRAVTEATKVKKCLKEYGADIILSMPNMRVIGCNLRQIVYMQQSLPFQKEKRFSFLKPEERSYAFRQYIQGTIIKFSLKRAEAVFVQTDWVKQAVKASVSDTKVINIGYPVDDGNDHNIMIAKELSEDFFYPCGPAIYKNISVLVRAVRRLKSEGFLPKIYVTLTLDEMNMLAGEDQVDIESFICLGRIAPLRVKEMYTGTTLVFPSYIETVGLPLVEAREAGTWIIASDCPFSHEILDEYPNKEYFKYDDDVMLAECMKKVLKQSIEWKQWQMSRDKHNCCWDNMMRYIQKTDE